MPQNFVSVHHKFDDTLEHVYNSKAVSLGLSIKEFLLTPHKLVLYRITYTSDVKVTIFVKFCLFIFLTFFLFSYFIQRLYPSHNYCLFLSFFIFFSLLLFLATNFCVSLSISLFLFFSPLIVHFSLSVNLSTTFCHFPSHSFCSF